MEAQLTVPRDGLGLGGAYDRDLLSQGGGAAG